MNKYLCMLVTLRSFDKCGEPFEVEAANEADAVVIAKHQQPPGDGQSMAVVFNGRILVGNAWTGMPVGQGGGSEKLTAAPAGD